MTKADFLFHIIATSGVPIYRQLLDQINTLIVSGRLKPGDFLPSIRQVGKELEINPMTASKAYSILEREGVLKNCRGQGMQVVVTSRPMKNYKDRKKVIQPLLEQVITHAHQLTLLREDVLEMLDTSWKEKINE